MADDEIVLQAADNEIVIVSRKIVTKRVPVIAEYLLNVGGSAGDLVFPVNKASKEGLQKIVEWLVKHDGEDLSEIMRKKDNDGKTPKLSDWDVEFFNNMSINIVSEILECSLFLQIQELYRMAVITTANKIRGKKNHYEIRDVLGITNPFSAEKQAEVNKETKWCR